MIIATITRDEQTENGGSGETEKKEWRRFVCVESPIRLSMIYMYI
jgi:hypothetical protein